MNDLKKYFFGKSAVVTGATGFVGSHLSRELLTYEARVTVLVRPESDLWRLHDILDKVDLVMINLSDLAALKMLMLDVKPNLIFHFAIPHHDMLQNEVDLQNQIELTSIHLENLFEAAQKMTVLDAFIHSCSGSVYDIKAGDYLLNEETSMKPTTLRGKLKLSQREKCIELANIYDIPVRLARIFRAYGPMESSTKLIAKAIKSYQKQEVLPIGSDDFKRDYIFIDDLTKGILLLARKKGNMSIELNFAGQAQYSAQEVVMYIENLLEDEIPKKLNAYPKNLYDQGSIKTDCSKAKEMLEWEPSTSIIEGLKKTLDWHQLNKYD